MVYYFLLEVNVSVWKESVEAQVIIPIEGRAGKKTFQQSILNKNIN